MRKKKKETITTIRIWGSTKKKLDLKKQNSLESYNEVIQKLLNFHDEANPLFMDPSGLKNQLLKDPISNINELSKAFSGLAKNIENANNELSKIKKPYEIIKNLTAKRE